MTSHAIGNSVRWEAGRCQLLDQRLLPGRIAYLSCETHEAVVEAIRTMAVRGAPAIGVAGAFGVVLAYRQALAREAAERPRYWEEALQRLRTARPTAVNLTWAVNRMEQRLRREGGGWREPLGESLREEAERIRREDIEANRRMALLGADLIPESEAAITYCNAGDLATAGIGTAVGVLAEAHRQGRIRRVFVCETRPLLQGLRLTAWELAQREIPFTVICDNMAASYLAQGRIGAAVVGADRIAANGDVANKIGTYALAIAAHYHGVPFLVAAPTSTFDLSLGTGALIPIEQRAAEEVTSVLGSNQPPFAMDVGNPAFDVTPARLISAIICERGVTAPPGEAGLRELVEG